MAASARPDPDAPDTIEALALAYRAALDGCPHAALRAVIADALADLCEIQRGSLQQDRLISYGYVRAALHGR